MYKKQRFIYQNRTATQPPSIDEFPQLTEKSNVSTRTQGSPWNKEDKMEEEVKIETPNRIHRL